MFETAYCVYILTNPFHTVFYVGYSSQLPGRMLQHKEKMADGFTLKYNVTKLVYYEIAEDKFAALEREKQIKRYRREKKKALINRLNPTWKDLTDSL